MALTGSFTGAGTSEIFPTLGYFDVSLSGFGTATVQLERSFDDGASWFLVETMSQNLSKRGYEPKPDVIYRLNCTAHTTGTILYRLD